MAKKTKKTEQVKPDVEPNPALAIVLDGAGFTTLGEAIESVMEKLKHNKPEKNDEVADAD